MAEGLRVLVSCEHGGNQVPAEQAHLFHDQAGLLAGHRGYDPGALELAHYLAAGLGAPLFAATITRLLVDLNRSPGHRALFSEITKPLPRSEKQQILATHYHPHRQQVAEAAHRLAGHGRLLHLAIHSFTPVLHGQVRTADIGLLYDSRRPPEREFCQRWQQTIRALAPALRVRCNYPYLGKNDGLATWLRRSLAADAYLGVELEVNQALFASPPAQGQQAREVLLRSLQLLVADGHLD